MNAILMTDTMPEEQVSAMARKTVEMETGTPRSTVNIIVAAVLLLLLSVAAWRLLDPATLPIKHVRVEGNFQHLSRQKMQSMVSEVIRGGFFNLNVSSIKNALLSEPWVHWVSVQRKWPDGLSVQVKEQTAVGHWNDDALLSASAQVFSPEEAELIPGLPYLSGPSNTQDLVLNRYIEIQRTLSLFGIQIDRLTLSDRRAWQMQLQNGPLVIFGRSDVDSRITRFTRSVVTGLGEEVSKARQVDMRYTNGFAVEWKQEIPQIDESRLKNDG